MMKEVQVQQAVAKIGQLPVKPIDVNILDDNDPFGDALRFPNIRDTFGIRRMVQNGNEQSDVVFSVI